MLLLKSVLVLGLAFVAASREQEHVKDPEMIPEPAVEAPPKKIDIALSDVVVTVKDASGSEKPIDVAYPKGMLEDVVVEKNGKVSIALKMSAEEVAQVHVRLMGQAASKTVPTSLFRGVHTAALDTASKELRKLVEGTYRVDVLVAGPRLSKPLAWTMGKLVLNTGVMEKPNGGQAHLLKELEYTFPPPPTPASAPVALLFTLLCGAPQVLLLATWVCLGVNLKNFRLSLSSLLFHGGMAGLLGIFTMFWIKWTMLQALSYMTPMLLIVFLAGNQLLKHHQM